MTKPITFTDRLDVTGDGAPETVHFNVTPPEIANNGTEKDATLSAYYVNAKGKNIYIPRDQLSLEPEYIIDSNNKYAIGSLKIQIWGIDVPLNEKMGDGCNDRKSYIVDHYTHQIKSTTHYFNANTPDGQRLVEQYKKLGGEQTSYHQAPTAGNAFLGAPYDGSDESWSTVKLSDSRKLTMMVGGREIALTR